MKSNFRKDIQSEGNIMEFVFQLVDYGSVSESIFHVTVIDCKFWSC